MKSRFFLFVSLGADILIATAKFIAAGFTGSSAMLSEGLHSAIDVSSQVLLILGVRNSKKKPDEDRPFGYGKELYFWSFVVSLAMFLSGGCVSVYEGIARFSETQIGGNPNVSYLILGISFLFTVISMFSALKAFNKERGDTPFFEAIKKSKDPSTFTTLLGDMGDIVGLVLAFFGVFLGSLFHNPKYDGLASIAIGLMLIAISGLLLRESKSLLMGEPISRTTVQKIIAMTEADGAIIKVRKHFSMYMAPDEILLQLMATFKKDLTTDELTEAIERISTNIKKRFPRIRQIFIEPVAK